ncbi:MAG: hypothetical protein D6160_20650 [Ketobacter sp.]|nr:MAG: hypothetical protein D6160_20650 [Ketobacter sp.]
MINVECKLFELLTPIQAACLSGTAVFSSEVSVLVRAHESGLLYDTLYMRITSDNETFSVYVDLYRNGFARVRRFKRDGERTVYGKVGTVWHPVNMAKLNQFMVDYIEAHLSQERFLMRVAS